MRAEVYLKFPSESAHLLCVHFDARLDFSVLEHLRILPSDGDAFTIREFADLFLAENFCGVLIPLDCLSDGLVVLSCCTLIQPIADLSPNDRIGVLVLLLQCLIDLAIKFRHLLLGLGVSLFGATSPDTPTHAKDAIVSEIVLLVRVRIAGNYHLDHLFYSKASRLSLYAT